MMSVIKSIVLGFIAGAIATLTVHEAVSALFQANWVGWDRVSWDFDPIANPVNNAFITDFAPPKIVSATFWGGVWGSILALILGALPQGPLTFKGLFFGLVGPALIGVFILVPLIRGGEMFFGGDMSKIIPVLCILAAWGAVTGWLYGFFRYARLP
jgi:hypothetical protein